MFAHNTTPHPPHYQQHFPAAGFRVEKQQTPHAVMSAAGVQKVADLEQLLAIAEKQNKQLPQEQPEPYHHYRYHHNYHHLGVNEGVSSNTWMLKVIYSLLWLTFLVFVVYALVVSNTKEINDKCGDSLWKFVISSFFINILQLFTVCIGVSIALCLVVGADEHRNNSDCFLLTIPLLVLLFAGALIGTLIGIGFTVTQAAMENAACTAALSAVSFTDTPLLGILSYVYLAADCLLLFFVFCTAVLICCLGKVSLSFLV